MSIADEVFVSTYGPVVTKSDDWVTVLGAKMPFAVTSEVDNALSEWYQARKDKRLNRLRSKEYPNLVAYKHPTNEDAVSIIDEADGTWYYFWKGQALSSSWPREVREFRKQALEHFHPEPPKPWLDAEEGEVWIIKPDDKSDEEAVLLNNYGDYESASARYSVVDAEEWISGRRIWPEESE